jgi:shikimate dehydrogenase
VKQITGTTHIYGIFGDPVSHSLSPLMQNEALHLAGIDAVYLPFHVRPSQLGSAVQGVRALQIRGVNVTVPHKEAILEYLDEIDAQARLIGAVNTVVNRDGHLVGYNTDAPGLVRALEEDLQFAPAGKQILLLGAGGASRAALVALAKAGAAGITVANRNPERARSLVSEFSALWPGTSFAHVDMGGETLRPVLDRSDLLVNSTSVGLKGESFTSISPADLPVHALVYDMVYRQGGTALLQAAKARGVRAADGLGMLAAQGEEAFFLWTGQRPPLGVMKRQVLACLHP